MANDRKQKHIAQEGTNTPQQIPMCRQMADIGPAAPAKPAEGNVFKDILYILASILVLVIASFVLFSGKDNTNKTTQCSYYSVSPMPNVRTDF